MTYAAKVAKEASSVTKHDIRELHLLGFNDSEIFDIAALAAGRAFFSNLVEGLGALPDGAYNDIPKAMQIALQVGRPIAASAEVS